MGKSTRRMHNTNLSPPRPRPPSPLSFTRNTRGSSRMPNGSTGVNACVPPHVHLLFSWLYLIYKDSGTKEQERSSLWIWRGVWPPFPLSRRPKGHSRGRTDRQKRESVKYRDSNLTGTYWAPLTTDGAREVGRSVVVHISAIISPSRHRFPYIPGRRNAIDFGISSWNSNT